MYALHTMQLRACSRVQLSTLQSPWWRLQPQLRSLQGLCCNCNWACPRIPRPNPSWGAPLLSSRRFHESPVVIHNILPIGYQDYLGILPCHTSICGPLLFPLVFCCGENLQFKVCMCLWETINLLHDARSDSIFWPDNSLATRIYATKEVVCNTQFNNHNMLLGLRGTHHHPTNLSWQTEYIQKHCPCSLTSGTHCVGLILMSVWLMHLWYSHTPINDQPPTSILLDVMSINMQPNHVCVHPTTSI